MNTIMNDNELDLIRDELVKAMKLAEQGKHRQSVETCLRCLKAAAQKSVPLPEGFAGALLTRIGLSQAQQDDWEQALYHYRLAEGVLLRRKDSVRQIKARYHVAVYSTEDDLRLLLVDIYQALGTAYDTREEWDRAITYYRQAYKVAQSMENLNLQWRALSAVANSYQQRGEWNELQSIAEKMLLVNERNPQPTREITARRYLAQVYGKTACLDDMLAELERIVIIGRESGHPDVARDEITLIRAQEMIVAKVLPAADILAAAKPATSTLAVQKPATGALATDKTGTDNLSIVTLNPDQARLTINTPEAQPITNGRPGTGSLYNLRSGTPTPPEITNCPPDLIQSIAVETHNESGQREAAFVLQTRYLEQTIALFQLFRPALLPVSIPAMKQLGERGLNLPSGGNVYVEWSLHDMMPNALLNMIVIPDDKHDVLEMTNRETRRLTIYIEGKEGRFGKKRRVLLPGIFEPYVLDWRGMTGVVRYLRRTYMRDRDYLTEQEAQHLLSLLQMPLRDGLPATGIYREMGFIYRLMNALDDAIRCFQDEISFSMNNDGVPGNNAAQAFRQLGLIYKSLGQRDKAFEALRAGLAVNPNSFDTLTAIASVMNDPTEALRFLGRAYRIRKKDPMWEPVMAEVAEIFNRTIPQIEQAAAITATQVDLSQRYELDRTSLVRLGIV